MSLDHAYLETAQDVYRQAALEPNLGLCCTTRRLAGTICSSRSQPGSMPAAAVAELRAEGFRMDTRSATATSHAPPLLPVPPWHFDLVLLWEVHDGYADFNNGRFHRCPSSKGCKRRGQPRPLWSVVDLVAIRHVGLTTYQNQRRSAYGAGQGDAA